MILSNANSEFEPNNSRFIIDLCLKNGTLQMACQMRRSKLELYQEILEALKDKPLNVDCLSYQTNIDCAALKQRLNFLIQNGLIKEKTLKRGTLFAVSYRGLAVLKALNVQRHMEQVKKAMLAAEGTIQAEMPAQKRQHFDE